MSPVPEGHAPESSAARANAAQATQKPPGGEEACGGDTSTSQSSDGSESESDGDLRRASSDVMEVVDSAPDDGEWQRVEPRHKKRGKGNNASARARPGRKAVPAGANRKPDRPAPASQRGPPVGSSAPRSSATLPTSQATAPATALTNGRYASIENHQLATHSFPSPVASEKENLLASLGTETPPSRTPANARGGMSGMPPADWPPLPHPHLGVEGAGDRYGSTPLLAFTPPQIALHLQCSYPTPSPPPHTTSTNWSHFAHTLFLFLPYPTAYKTCRPGATCSKCSRT